MSTSATLPWCLQGQSQVYGHGGRAAATLRIDHGEDFSPAALLRLFLGGVRRTKASSRSVVVVGRSINSRAPERIALTMTCGCAMLPTANISVRHFLVDQFNAVPGCGRPVCGMSTRIT